MPVFTYKNIDEAIQFINKKDLTEDDVEMKRALASKTRRGGAQGYLKRRPSLDMTRTERMVKSIEDAREESQRFAKSPYRKTRRLSLTPRM